MSSIKIIENPEVPGLECFLPPPPPPPFPPPPPPPPPPPSSSSSQPSIKSSENNTEITTEEQQQRPVTTSENTMAASTILTTTTEETVSTLNTSFSNIPVSTTPYILHPAIQSQTGQPVTTPWWIPTDSDTADVYTQWYDPNYKGVTASPVTNQTVVKTKNKYYKRKSEFIDPAQDAEKVASAQRELSALMKPLKCDLCNAVMNSTLQAKLHYDGKPHQKKVSMFLNQSVKKQKTEDGMLSNTTKKDWQNYCDICKTWFTSQTDATQHYAGKKHIRAANGRPCSRPSKKLQNQFNQVDPTGRFGIGMAFQTDLQPAAAASTPDVPTSVPNSAAAIGPVSVYTSPLYPTPLRCDLCGISANRQDQLETHKRGARHLRMLRLNGLPVPEPVPESENAPNALEPIDYSIYRTPSGHYYCAPCNLSLNSEIAFAQHVESKKHKNQSNPKSPNAVGVAKKARFKKK